MNKVIAGDYQNHIVNLTWKTPFIARPFGQPLRLDKENVEEYEVIDETARTSASSAIGRATVGAIFLGPIGLAAGLSAKKKGTHHVAIQFKDGKRSLIEIDDRIYKALMKSLF